MTGSLSLAQRARALEQLKTTRLDVLVIGGGVVGAGAALDAASRGLSVGLIEARDWASGTSSRSSKLLHGGLRYLEMLDFALVQEALRERDLILRRLAPHLAQPLRFLYPLTHHVWERFYVGAGLVMYDMMAARGAYTRAVPGHRHLSKRATLECAPGLRADVLVGAVEYHDGHVDDARHVLGLVRSAALHGTLVASRAEAVQLLRDGARVVGVRVRDVEDGGEIDVYARQVVSATGVWTDDTRRLLGEQDVERVRASKGVHVLIPRERIASSSALLVRTETSVVLAIPWGRHWILGTTDTDWDLDKSRLVASQRDIDYILAQMNGVLAEPLTRDDVVGVYSGLRPLVRKGDEPSARVSREHVVERAAPGLVTVAGGKFTTYRVMAKDVIDFAAAELGDTVPDSVTDRLPLLGASGFEAAWNRRLRLASDSGLGLARIEHLLRRYGTLVDELLTMVAEEPDLGRPVDGADDYLRAEVVYAAAAEGALHLDDVLERRTHIAMEMHDRGAQAAVTVAQLMAEVLGWSDRQIEAEVGVYLERVATERAAEQEPDDERAAAALVDNGASRDT